MKNAYIALLRGINVGGNNKIKMADLRPSLERAGFEQVSTYIQSGNVLFVSPETNTQKLASKMEGIIKDQFGVSAAVVVISKQRWEKIIANAPKDWGVDAEWKHNLLVLLEPYDMQEVVAAIGVLKPDIETLVPGDGVLYQSMSRALFGRTTTGKLASNPIYQRMTIRNYNTAQKLLSLLDQQDND